MAARILAAVALPWHRDNRRMHSTRSGNIRRWDIFCRVIDNFGDVGVCWRLARDLASRGQRVRLVLDDTTALAWMAPAGTDGVQVLRWPGPDDGADVVIEAFGCDLPAARVARMSAAAAAPLWINLEYLSAESYVERSHALPSPQAGGLVKWFFFPGFTSPTGGLLREPGLLAEHAAFDRLAWLAAQGLALRDGERVISLFCYDSAPAAPWLATQPDVPTLLLLTAGTAPLLRVPALPNVRMAALPLLPQPAFDRLLWSCDINVVRGEDSLVRAIWAGVPFIWQAYRQADGAHLVKVEALIRRLALPEDAAALWRAWNAPKAPDPWPAAPAFAAWRAAAVEARGPLIAQPDLVTQLLGFAPEQPSGNG